MSSQLTGLRGLIVAVGLSLFSATCLGIATNPASGQDEYEKSVGAVVRNKEFFKAGHFDVAATAGLMPYDSLMNHYQVGGRLTWHVSDHIGWEIVDLNLPFGSPTGYTNELVSTQGLTNGVQAEKIKLMAASNILISPLYGKLRFFGASVIHFDIYLAAGLGYHSSEITKYSGSTGGPVTETVIGSKGGFLFDVGLGLKLYPSRFMGLTVDLRDYFTTPTLYGNSSPKSNFTVTFGAVFFLPSFG